MTDKSSMEYFDPYFRLLVILAKRNGWERNNGWASATRCGICNQGISELIAVEDVVVHGITHLQERNLLAFL